MIEPVNEMLQVRRLQREATEAELKLWQQLARA
jgi:hypothetical protein